MTGMDNIGGMKVGVVVDCVAVTKVVLATLTVVFLVSVTNDG